MHHTTPRGVRESTYLREVSVFLECDIHSILDGHHRGVTCGGVPLTKPSRFSDQRRSCARRLSLTRQSREGMVFSPLRLSGSCRPVVAPLVSWCRFFISPRSFTLSILSAGLRGQIRLLALALPEMREHAPFCPAGSDVA